MITVSDVTLRFGTKTLFSDVNLKFVNNECYGIVGANGAGKSTFLKLLNGDIETTHGEIIIPKNERISILEQDHYKYDEEMVIDVVIMGNKKLYDIREEKNKLYQKSDFTDADGIKLGELEAEFLDMNGWDAETDASKLLSNLGVDINLHYLKMKELENNDKVKVLLAKSIFQNPDILLLDEPTNNLDINAINWLSEFIINYQNCVIVVSHDRHFLNTVCTSIVDIDYHKMTLYKGNYDFFVESNLLMQKQIKDANKKREEKIKELKEFIARFSANASKSRQATSRKKILDSIVLEELVPSSRKYPYIDFKINKGNAREVLNVSNLVVEENGEKLLNKISFIVLKGDKIAIIGDNIRKTLLFDVLTKKCKYTKGEIKFCVNANVSYFESDNTKYFKDNVSIIEWISKYKDIDDEEVLRSFLGRMLFSGDDVKKQVNVLSGGEKARLMLSKMMLEEPNFLILDEPTNHLDLESITSLNKGMEKFQGEILFTSMDYELNATVANRIIEILDDGTIIDDVQLVGGDEKEDIAILLVKGTNYEVATIRQVNETNPIRLGETVFAIGNPLGKLGGSVTKGIISCLNREIKVENQIMRLMQTDVAINSGNSGGGLFDINGNLIGIVNAKVSATGVEGIAFAISIDNATRVATELIENHKHNSDLVVTSVGYVKGRVELGFTASYTALMSGFFITETALYVSSVDTSLGAFASGLRQYDKIVSITKNDKTYEMTSGEVYQTFLDSLNVGDTITLNVKRNTNTFNFVIKATQKIYNL